METVVTKNVKPPFLYELYVMRFKQMQHGSSGRHSFELFFSPNGEALSFYNALHMKFTFVDESASTPTTRNKLNVFCFCFSVSLRNFTSNDCNCRRQ